MGNHTKLNQSVEVNVQSPKIGSAESVKLMMEMETSAKENILNRIVLKNNLVEAQVIYFQKPMVMDKVYINARFMLNGMQLELREEIDCFEWRHKQQEFSYMHAKERLLNTFYSFFAKAIAAELIKQTPNMAEILD